MSDRFYSVDLKYTGSQVPVPAQTGIRDQRTANAIRLLYPKRLSPTVGEDTVSISALGRAVAQAAKGGEPSPTAAKTTGPEDSRQAPPEQPPAVAQPSAQAAPKGGSTATWVA